VTIVHVPGRALPTKACAGCGRIITWRKRWERDWDEVRWCSTACRERGLTPTDVALQASLVELLDRRAAAATVCPSEAARAVAAGEGRPDAWRDLMEPARAAARRLVEAGRVEITQGGHVVDPSTARGPIRVRRAR
jgi:hypothetical protein